MNILDPDRCTRWCAERGLDIAQPRHPRFSKGAGQPFEIRLPSLGLEVVALASVLTRSLEDGGDERHPRTLLWLVERGMWSEEAEGIGALAWRKLLAGHGLPDAPGVVFEPDDGVAQKAFLVIAMLFQWDALLVPDHGGYVVEISHDGCVRLTSRDDAFARQLASIASAWSQTV